PAFSIRLTLYAARLRLLCSVFFFSRSGPRRDLHSFPTRRSSDLRDADVTIVAGCGVHTETGEPARHSGIHRFFLEPGAHVKYVEDRKSTRLNSSHVSISYAVFCLKKKRKKD